MTKPKSRYRNFCHNSCNRTLRMSWVIEYWRLIMEMHIRWCDNGTFTLVAKVMVIYIQMQREKVNHVHAWKLEGLEKYILLVWCICYYASCIFLDIKIISSLLLVFLSWSHDFNAFQACVKLCDRVCVLVFSLLLNYPQMIKWKNVKGVEWK